VTVTDSLYARIAALEAISAKAAVVTVVRATGSTPRAPGARMLVLADGSIEGTIGGGRIEAEAIRLALLTIEEGRPQYLEHQLTQELGMCCGGSVSLFIEPLERKPILIIYGAGHVGTALTRMAAHAGFAVHVADEREELLTTERLAEARKLHDDLDDPALPFGPESYVMVTTHDHPLDQKLVEKVLPLAPRWLGLIGSRRKPSSRGSGWPTRDSRPSRSPGCARPSGWRSAPRRRRRSRSPLSRS
jgi:xanthine dehydrogenase accessory factor